MLQNKIIVCFSYNSPPQNDPEAFCTARFLSSLANNGFLVHLITMDHQQAISQPTVDQLLSNKIIITRLKFPEKPNKLKVLLTNIQSLFFSGNSWEISYIAEKVKEILVHYKDPILLTRSSPALSNIIGYRLHKMVKCWIAHFSDPFPGYGFYSRRTYYYKFFDKRWSKKIFFSSSHITVTCNKAKEHFILQHGKQLENKISVIYHVGFPPLNAEKFNLNWDKNNFYLVHVGNLTDKRYAKEIILEMQNISYVWPEFRFVQFGLIDVTASKLLSKEHSWLKIEANKLTSPNKSSYILESADINIIIDTKEKLSYSPYLPSKFAYAIAAGKPLIAVGIKCSEMALLSEKYTSIYFADITIPGSLFSKILEIKNTFGHLKNPEKELAYLFSSEKISEDFQKILQIVN